MNFTDPKIGIIGYGKVGSALGVSWSSAGIEVWALDKDILKLKQKIDNRPIGICSSAEELLDLCSVIFLCLREEDLSAQVDTLEKLNVHNIILAHTAGSLSTDIFSSLKTSCQTAVFHPYRSFTGLTTEPGILENSFIGIVADSKIFPVLAELVKILKATPVKLDASNLPLYHASATILAGGTVCLIDSAEKFLKEAGFPEQYIPELVTSFVLQIIENIEKQGTREALSGPWKRRAIQVIQKHIDVINEKFPQTINLYLSLAQQVMDTEDEDFTDILDIP